MTIDYLDLACKKLCKDSNSAGKILLMDALRLADKGKLAKAQDKAKEALEAL